MKVEVIHSENWEGEPHVEIIVNGRSRVSIGSLCECPEDATLYRDLFFVYDIPNLIELAYEAGKRGEDLIIDEWEEENE